MTTVVHAVSRPEVPPLAMSDRFRHEITYFMALPENDDSPALASGQYRVRPDEIRQWLEDGVFHLVSPLDSEKKTEIELSEEQETWLEWMSRYKVELVELR
jgi:hypothetical protein